MARPRLICLLLALITVLAYWPVRNAELVVFDDLQYVTENVHVQAGLTWAGVKWAFTTFYAGNWHPLTWLSHMLDASLFGPDARAQHFVNVLFHAANAALLFLLLYRMTKKLWPAAFVAALFAWHPVHVESVAWVSERKDVLSTFFGLLALIAYVRYVEESKGPNPSEFAKVRADEKAKVWWRWALAFFALGLMAKPMLVTLPFVMLLLDVWPLGRLGSPQSTVHSPQSKSWYLLVSEKIPFFVLTIASCVVTYFAQRGEAVMSFERRPLGLRLTNAAVAYVEYLAKMVCPIRLAVFYPLPGHVPAWQVVVAVVILAALTVYACRVWRRAPYVLVGWLWFLGTLVPVIGIIQVGGQALADRYAYIPLVGIFIAVAYGAADLKVRFRVKTPQVSAAAGIVLAGCLIGTEHQLSCWQNSEMLFRHALAVTRDNGLARVNLGYALEQQGRREEALGEYHRAIELDPGRSQAHNNLAILLESMGKRTEAVEEYREALRLNPNAALAHLNFGGLVLEMGKFNEAMAEYREAARLAPDDPRPDYLMGKACLRRGDSVEGVKHLRDSLKISPNDVQTLTLLARVLAADKDSNVRYGKEAVTLAQRANDLTGGGDPFVLDTLAMAYAEDGRFKEAQDTEQRVIELADSGAKEMVPDLRERLQRYQSGLPYREDFSKTLSESK